MERKREGEREGLRISPGMIGCGGRHTKLHCLVWGSTALHEGVFCANSSSLRRGVSILCCYVRLSICLICVFTG